MSSVWKQFVNMCCSSHYCDQFHQCNRLHYCERFHYCKRSITSLYYKTFFLFRSIELHFLYLVVNTKYDNSRWRILTIGTINQNRHFDVLSDCYCSQGRFWNVFALIETLYLLHRDCFLAIFRSHTRQNHSSSLQIVNSNFPVCNCISYWLSGLILNSFQYSFSNYWGHPSQQMLNFSILVSVWKSIQYLVSCCPLDRF